MKSYYILAASLLIAFSAFAKDENIKTDPIGFRENKGQLVDQNDNKRNDILYYGSINQMSYYLKKDGISYQLYKKSEGSDDITIQRLDISWLGANTLTTVERAGKLIAKENYYNTPDGKEILAVESFETVRYKNIYQGIDLKYYHKEGSLKYDYIVKPYEDYKRIALKVEGADQITLNADGTISLQTPLGTITEGKPVAYQDGRAINTNWKLDGNILSFVVSDYDRSKELVIDPLVYHWLKNYGSYPGGTGFGAVQNDILTSATDNMGNVIVGGRYDNIPSMGNPAVVFMTKYDAAGSFIWDYQALNTAYFGSVEDIFVNNNTIYFCGATTAQNIATSGSYQVVLGGQTDAIIEKISSFGAVVWRSYYGGANTDIAKSCSVDGNGNLFIAGTTNSNNNISSVAAYQSVIGGANDGFLINMDTNGVRKWGTYFGGSGNEQVNSCASKNGHIKNY